MNMAVTAPYLIVIQLRIGQEIVLFSQSISSSELS